MVNYPKQLSDVQKEKNRYMQLVTCGNAKVICEHLDIFWEYENVLGFFYANVTSKAP